MKISESAINFNKEILFGEIGAMIGAPLSSYIASQFTSTVNSISTFTVVGAGIGSSVFWLAMRIYDKIKNNDISKKKFVEDLAYLVPVASLLVFVIYYPSLYMLSNYFLENDYRAFSSAIFSQVSAFVLFILSLNVYRHILIKVVGKKL